MPGQLDSDPPPAAAAPLAALWPEVYAELRRLAHARLRRSGPNSLLDTTALVHETYLRLARLGSIRLEERGRFFAYCSQVMRSIIVDLLRRAASADGGALQVTLNTAVCDAVAAEDDPLAIDEAMRALATVEPRLAQVVEMRYFGGFSEVEIAEALGLTDRTVRRDWERARLLLRAMLAG